MSRKPGISTLVTHSQSHPQRIQAHIPPIYQSSAFRFDSVEDGAELFQNQQEGYIYTRMTNPNHTEVVEKIAALEGLDLEVPVGGHLFASGMAAIHAAVLAAASPGSTIIAQQNLYGASYSLLNLLHEQKQMNIIWLAHGSQDEWRNAFNQHPEAALAYAETPSNPNLSLVDLQAVAKIAHQAGARLLVDNTFASPYCQRPFSFDADFVVHSTTKYLCGHGVVIGGVVLSTDRNWVQGPLYNLVKLLGATPSPFDAWLTDLGLRTFEIRMQRHCQNAFRLAEWLEGVSPVERVYYPGLVSHPQYELACRQMVNFGGMLAFELKGGLMSGKRFMNHLKLFSLVPTLGNVDSLVQHPASMSHATVPHKERLKVGVTEGLIRVSVGIENFEDLQHDFEQALDSL